MLRHEMGESPAHEPAVLRTEEASAWRPQLSRLIATRVSAAEMGRFIQHQVPAAQRDEVWTQLQQQRGNAYVQAVLASATEREMKREGGPRDPIALLAAIKAGETAIRIEGDKKFQDKILALLTTLASKPAGLGLLDQLASSPYAVRVAPLQGDQRSTYMTTTPDDFEARLIQGDGTPGAGTGTTILINPALPETFGLDAEGNRIPSPTFINIGHELIHALHNAQGVNRRDRPGTHPGEDNLEEETTIETGEISENVLRKEHALPLRGSHGGGLAETARTRLVDAYQHQEGVLLSDVYAPTPPPEAIARTRAFIEAADQVLALDELWEVNGQRVAEYREQAKRFVGYAAHRQAVWKRVGPQITAGYDQLRQVLAAARAEDAEFYGLVTASGPEANQDPAKLTTPPYATLDRGPALRAIEDLRAMIDHANQLGGELGAARTAFDLLQRLLGELAPLTSP